MFRPIAATVVRSVYPRQQRHLASGSASFPDDYFSLPRHG
jgi:hypothetical protein